MANDTYTANADSSCYVGMFNRPSWVANQAVNTWGVVPLAIDWSDVDPANDPLVNPNYPSAAPWQAVVGFSSRFTAWNGHTSYNGVIYDGPSGGHDDYAGNESFKANLKSEAPEVARLINPSGAIGNTINLDDGLENTGVYADGRPRSPHNYNGVVYHPPTNTIVLAIQGTGLYSSGVGGTRRPIAIDANTGEMVQFGPELTTGGLGFEFAGCYDSLRELVWVSVGGTSRMYTYNPATNEKIDRGVLFSASGEKSLTYLPDHDCLLMITAAKFVVFDCATYTYYEPALSGSFVGMVQSGETQPHYIGNNTVAIWDNTTETTIINTLSFIGDPRTATWQVGQLNVDVSNTVSPTTKAPNGTFGKFQWHPTLGIFTLKNRLTDPMYFFKVAT